MDRQFQDRQFQLAVGSVIGRDHRTIGKNNQDAAYWLVDEDVTIAAVCDGCGSCPHSEVGAQLLARLTVKTLAQTWQQAISGDWNALRHQLLTQLQTILSALDKDIKATLRDYFLCTILGVIATPRDTVLFALGDGVMIVNGQVLPFHATSGNAPPYLGYGILEWLDRAAGNEPMAHKWATMSQFQCCGHFSTAEIESVLIGSDGTLDLMGIANHPLPGKTDPVGDISQFWQDDRYFHNPDMVRRRLSLINREVTILDPQTGQLVKYPGLLPDDTTLIVLRKILPTGG